MHRAKTEIRQRMTGIVRSDNDRQNRFGALSCGTKRNESVTASFWLMQLSFSRPRRGSWSIAPLIHKILV